MIIDSHTHLLKKKWNGKGSYEDLIKEMEKGGVDKTVLIPEFRSDEWHYDTTEIIKTVSEDDRFIVLVIDAK